MSDQPSDDELLRAHVAGDPDAFGELFGRHRDRMWRVALRTTGDPEDAADALQEAMIAAFRRAESFRGDSAVTTWLHRIVVNAGLDRLRRRAVRAAEPLPDDLDEAAARGDVAIDPAPDPADAAIAGDTVRRVHAALDRLPPDQKAAIVLVDLEGFRIDEAAAVLDCASGTVKSRCSRGRSRLAELLRDAERAVPSHPGTGPPAAASHKERTRPERPDPHQQPGGDQP